MTRLSAVAAFLSISIASAPAVAAGDVDCFAKAGQLYGVEPMLLRSIAQVESSFRSIVHSNPDGSEDIGIMQINSWWLSSLARFGITRRDLVLDPCTNIHVGAWILEQEIQTHGYNWKAVGAYNAKSPDKAAAYARAVWQVYQEQKAGKRKAPIVATLPAVTADPVQPKLREQADAE